MRIFKTFLYFIFLLWTSLVLYKYFLSFLPRIKNFARKAPVMSITAQKEKKPFFYKTPQEKIEVVKKDLRINFGKILNHFKSFLIFTFFLLGGFGLGKSLFRKYQKHFSNLEDFIYSAGLGFGILGILLFLLGILGVFERKIILGIVAFCLLANLRDILTFLKRVKLLVSSFVSSIPSLARKKLVIGGLFLGFLGVNLIGCLAPEIGFDALYYHLTLPKIYLVHGVITRIGGLFDNVSSWPKLGEMIYMFGLAVGDQTVARLFHFTFGLFSAGLIFSFVKKQISSRVGLIVSLIFYSMPIVSWLSTSGYVELFLTFYLLASGLLFFQFLEKRNLIFLILSAVFFGFACGVKILALGFLPFFLIAVVIWQIFSKINLKKIFFSLTAFLGIVVLVGGTWYLVSFFWTGNPVYPFFKGSSAFFGGFRSGIAKSSDPGSFLGSFYFSNFWKATFYPDDHLTPLFLILLPLSLFFIKKSRNLVFFLMLFFACSLLWFKSSLESNRYLLPIMPFFIIGASFLFKLKDRLLLKFLLSIVLVVAFGHLIYRAGAIFDRLPVALGKESEPNYLRKVVATDPESYYSDGFLEKNLKKGEKVLIFGVHQLFYLDFPFDHFSYAKDIKNYQFVLVKGEKIPVEFDEFELVHQDKETNVRIFEINEKKVIKK